MGNDDEGDLPVIELSTDAPPRPAVRPRHGDRRRVVAVVIAAALAVAAVAAYAGTRADTHHASEPAATIRLPSRTVASSAPAVASTASAFDPDAEFIGTMRAIAPGVGWAMNGFAIYETTDNAAHWRNVTPPGLVDPIGHVDALTFLDANHAWVAAAINSEPFTLWRTVDGGRSWQPVRGHFCTPTTAVPSCAPTELDFVDPQHGWAVVSSDGMTGRLLATVDGGTTWAPVGPTPFAQHVQFVSPGEAWGANATRERGPAGTLDPGAIFHTTDAGRSWQRVPLPRTGSTAPMLIDAPFFGPGTVIAATATFGPLAGTAPVIGVSVTRDGGAHWSHHPIDLFSRADSGAVTDLRFSAAGTSDWALAAGAFVNVTHDAGLIWTPAVPTGGTVHDVALSSPTDGWILADNRVCSPAEPDDNCPVWLLYRMTVAVQVWDLASPSIGITANRSP